MKSIIAWTAALVALATFAFAAIPQTINYQGYMKDTATGVPTSGAVNITFSLYEGASHGTPLWSETHSSVPINNGIYSVSLGSIDPAGNPLNRPFDREYFLGISVNGGTEMAPRQALTAVPYAMHAVSADRLTLLCSKGDFLNCYTGEITTMGKGLCRAGNRICLPTRDGFSAACAGEILPAVEVCDNLDNDCDGAIDNKIAPQSCYSGPAGTLNVGTCTGGQQNCSGGQWSACSGEVVPVPETCDNKDNDCDGVVDAFLQPCYTGPGGTMGVGICKAGARTCTAGAFGACVGEVLPAIEVCGNAVDENCNGVVNEENALGCIMYRKDADQDGYGISADTKCLCAPLMPYTAANSGQSDCNDTSAAAHPGATEICNGIDDNCNGQVDEAGASGCTIYYLDVDRDGYGTASNQCLCAPAAPYDSLYSTDCNDTRATVHPGATEICNGIDDNCNGQVDEGC
ncbi:MAG: putative metal-binding motif-containing protein [Desulfuromonadaceae bacterium]